MRRIDLTGRRFDKLTVIGEVGRDKYKHILWLCVCTCGNHITKHGGSLLHPSGRTFGCRECASKSIGDFKRKHGESRGRLYGVWKAMRQRCENSRARMYRWYGAKGVAVCTAWQDYKVFASWAHSSGYQSGLTIERKDPKGIYEPMNCEWITRSENSKRRNAAARSGSK